MLFAFPRARARATLAGGFDPGGAELWDSSAPADRNRKSASERGAVTLCSLRSQAAVIGLLIPGHAGADDARGQCWSVLADSEARRRFAFLDFKIGGGGANRHSQPLRAEGRPSDIAFGYGPRSELWWNSAARPLLESARQRGPR